MKFYGGSILQLFTLLKYFSLELERKYSPLHIPKLAHTSYRASTVCVLLSFVCVSKMTHRLPILFFISLALTLLVSRY